MPTTVHIPAELLRSVDRRAKALGVSRNRLIVRAVEQSLEKRQRWPPEFLDRLTQVEAGTGADVGRLLKDVMRARRSKAPLDL